MKYLHKLLCWFDWHNWIDDHHVVVIVLSDRWEVKRHYSHCDRCLTKREFLEIDP